MKKKDLQQIKDIFLEAFEPFAISIQKEFVKNSGEHREIREEMSGTKESIGEIKSQLWKLERRVFAIEEMLTEHGRESRKHTKELQKIWKELKAFKNQNENNPDMPQFIALEKRVGALEAEVVK